jgi:hypothetical protein
MSRYDDSSSRDRLTRASEAKQAMLARFKQALDPGTPAAIEKRRQRESIAAARAERNAKRESARQERERELAMQAVLEAQAAAEAERAAVERAAREAAEQAELEATLKAEPSLVGGRAEGQARRALCRTEGSKKPAAERPLNPRLATSNCGSRRSYFEVRPDVVALAATLAAQGHLTGGGKPYVASAVQAMLAA